VGKAPQVGIGYDLTVIVLDKTVEQRAQVRQDSDGDKEREQFVSGGSGDRLIGRSVDRLIGRLGDRENGRARVLFTRSSDHPIP
jgi:hypothetical protein